MKRKVFFTALILLSMIFIVGMGFSVWLMVNDPVDDVASGNIVAYGVYQNGELAVDIVSDTGGTPSERDQKIIFGSPPTPLDSTIVDPPWLIFNDIGEEHLTVYIKVTVTCEGIFEITDDILLSGVSVKSGWKLFGGPDYELDIGHSSYEAGHAPTLDTSGSVPKLNINSPGYVILKVTYKWPELFKFTSNAVVYTNPYYYFNRYEKNALIGDLYTSANNLLDLTGDPEALTSTSTYAQFAIAYLTKLYSVSENITFKITLTESLS